MFYRYVYKATSTTNGTRYNRVYWYVTNRVDYIVKTPSGWILLRNLSAAEEAFFVTSL